jgi:glutathione-independent formaldehyde dehydrogenase
MKNLVGASYRRHRGWGRVLAQDPGSTDNLRKHGQLAFNFGQFWMKGQHTGRRQAHVKTYNRKLRDLIAAQRFCPSEIISHAFPLDATPRGYSEFDKRSEGWTKVVLKVAA